MQKFFRNCFNVLFIILLSVIISSANSPKPPGGHAEGLNSAPGGTTAAPVGGGIAVFIAFAVGYAAWEMLGSGKIPKERDE